MRLKSRRLSSEYDWDIALPDPKASESQDKRTPKLNLNNHYVH